MHRILFSNKFHILFVDINPSPDKYKIPTVFVPDNTTSTFAVHCKGENTYSFGAGREHFNKTVVNRENPPLDKDLPGPGSYNHLKPLG